MSSRIACRVTARHFQSLLRSRNYNAISAFHPSQPALMNGWRPNEFVRFFSDKAGEPKVEESAQEGQQEEGQDLPLSREEQLEQEIESLQEQIKNMKDQWVRSVAEQENIRRIAKRDVQSARDFAISSFAKSLLDTSDNLGLALAAVPEELRNDKESNPVLATLYEGISMTDAGLTKAFEKNGLLKFGAVGETFDPNQHEALYEYPNPEQEPGTVGQVMKQGFILNNRVIRPAEVGVVRKP